jgi:hypothetical protein
MDFGDDSWWNIFINIFRTVNPLTRYDVRDILSFY